MTDHLLILIALWGPGLVFASVLLEQLGLPLPAMPTLMVAGALVSRERLDLGGVLGLALLACLVGDGVWFWAGRHFGPRAASLLSRAGMASHRTAGISSRRHRAGLLLVAKFVPGLSTLAPPLAGAAGVRWSTFVLMDLAGSLLWVGSALAVGYAFAPRLDAILDALRLADRAAAPVLAGMIVVAVIMQAWRHHARRRRAPALALARSAAAQPRSNGWTCTAATRRQDRHCA